MLRHLTALIATLLLAAPAFAEIQTNRNSGQSCQGGASADRAALLYNSAGVQNNDTVAPHVVSCPNTWVGPIANANSISAIVLYRDRSASDSLSCRLEAVDGTTGNTITGPLVHSCATSGGCATATPAFSSNSLSRLDLVLPAGTFGPAAWTVRCTLPRRSTTIPSNSEIVHYQISYNSVGF
jgi:hypothetical protein